MTDPSCWEPQDAPQTVITNLIHAGAMRLCPRCFYVPGDREETIFEPLGIITRRASQYGDEGVESHEVTISVLTLACTHCGYLIEHCVDYLKPSSQDWEGLIHVGLGADPEYDILDEVAALCRDAS